MKVSGRTEWVSDELFEQRRLWNLELQSTRSIGIIVTLWRDYGAQFSNVNVATALLSITRDTETQEAESSICEMVRHYLNAPEAITVRNAAGVVHALAHMRLTTPQAMQVRVEVFECIKQKVVEKGFLHKVTSFSLIRLLNGYAISAAKGDVVFTALDSVVKKTVELCKPCEVVEIAAAYSKKKYRSEALFAQIEEHVLKMSFLYEAGQLAHLAHAFSTFGCGSEQFYHKVYLAVAEQAARLDEKGIFYCLNAFGGRKQNLDVIHVLADVIRDKASGFLPKDLSQILNVFTKTRCRDDAFFEKMEKVVLDLLPRCNYQDLSLFAVAFSRARAGSAFFYSQLQHATAKQMQLFLPSSLLMMYYSFAVRGVVDHKFFAAMEEKFMKCQLDSKDTVIMLWSTLLSGRRERGFLSHFIDRLNKACDGKELGTLSQNRNKLIECSAILSKEMPDLYAALSKHVLTEIECARNDRSKELTDRSPFQEEVEAALRRSGVVFEAEYSLEGFSVDMFIPSQKRVIEVNGRPHYYRTDPQKLNATSLMKQRILELSGYKVSVIAYFEWPSVKDIALQDQFIKRLLD